MGKTTFICKVESTEAFEAAVRSLIHHNTTIMAPVGGKYTETEFEALDPLRASFFKTQLALIQDADVSMGCMEKWTRGEDISLERVCLVDHAGVLWLEATNGGGGACSTRFFEEHAPHVGWMGTRGKPDGFKDAPMATDWMHVREVSKRLPTLLAQRRQASGDSDPCMTEWKKIVQRLQQIGVGSEGVVSIDRAPGDQDVQRHYTSFMKMFNDHKKLEDTAKPNVLLTNGGGQMIYIFRGESQPEPVELIGVPTHDVLFYISNAGRVAVTGVGAPALLHRMGIQVPS